MTFVLDAARVFVAAAASALLLAGQAAAQPAAPRAAVEVSRGFDDAEFDFVVEGSIDASTLTSSCRGFINPEPTKVVDVTEHGAPLVIGVRSTQDTTLIVRSPSGNFVCDDDSGGELNPQVFISAPEAGRYEIWVGAYAAGQTAQGSLRIEEAYAAAPSRPTEEEHAEAPAEEEYPEARPIEEYAETPVAQTPPFPRWPPPRASDRAEIERTLFASEATLGDVADRLMRALRATGNPRASFYTAPGGFVMVARLERIRSSDARPEVGPRRFVEPRPGEPERPDDPLGYIEALFFAPEGRYRQVMFVVTDKPVVESSWELTPSGATELLNEGSAELVGPYQTAPFSPSHRVTALIYEFRKRGGSNAEITVPGRWAARTHLVRSGIMASLRD